MLHIIVHWEKSISNGDLYVYYSHQPEQVHYIGMTYEQDVSTRVSQELKNPSWRDRVQKSTSRGLLDNITNSINPPQFEVSHEKGTIIRRGWADKLVDIVNPKRKTEFHVETGFVEIVSGGERITKNLIKDIEGLLIVSVQPEINIKSKNKYQIKRAQNGIRLENRGSRVLPVVLEF